MAEYTASLHAASGSAGECGYTYAHDVTWDLDVGLVGLSFYIDDGSISDRTATISVWDSAGTLLAQRAVGSVSASNAYYRVDFASPATLTAGQTYRVGVHVTGTDFKIGRSDQSGFGATHAHATSPAFATATIVTKAYADAGTGRPTSPYTSSFAFEMAHQYHVTEANAAPNAPILTAPADGATINKDSTQRSDWDFSDSDAGDSQSKYDLRYRVAGAATWTDVTGTTPNTYHDFAAGTFTAGDYEWQVRTYDAQGVVGPYSGSSFFTAASAPDAPTITAPLNGETVDQFETVSWSTPEQQSYQLRRVADNAGVADTATVYYDSGEVVSSTARSATVEFPTNGRYEHVQVRYKNGGLWSAWASIRVLVSYTPPPAPTFSLLADNDAGALVVSITNPAPGVDEPAAIYNDVYVDDGSGEERKATLVAPNAAWTYRTPRANFDYSTRIRVVAVADSGITSSS